MNQKLYAPDWREDIEKESNLTYFDAKKARDHAIDLSYKYRAIDGLRRRLKKRQRAQRRLARQEGSTNSEIWHEQILHRRNEKKVSRSIQCAEVMEDWVIPRRGNESRMVPL